jgi:hypothetical protein
MEEAIFIIEQKLHRINLHYYHAKERLDRQKVGSKGWLKSLGFVQSCGSKRKVLLEVLNQLRRIHGGNLKVHKFSSKGSMVFVFGNSTDKRQSCLGKIPHKSLDDAQKCADSFFIDKGEEMDAYKCRHCEFWHIGHSLIGETSNTKTITDNLS